MKIMDEKGRLFGKINVIDFLVILFLLSLTPMFYFGYKIHNKQTAALKAQEQAQPQKPKEEFITMTINCKFIKLKPEVAQMVSVGDKELDSDGNLIGQIVSLGESAPYSYEFDVGPNKKLIRKDPELQQVTVILKINSVIRGKNIYYKDKQILEDGTLEFSSGKYSVEAEEVTIVKDKDSAAIDTRVQNAGVKKKSKKNWIW